MNIIRLGVFDNETGKKYVKKVDTGFYNSSGSLATFFTAPKMTNINNVKYYTTTIGVQTTESNLKDTLTLGTTILDLIESNVNETKRIYVMKNEKERTENYLSTTVTVDLFKNMRYYIGNNSIGQSFSSVDLEKENANIRMAYYYTIIDNIQVEFIGWVHTKPTGQTDDNGSPIVIVIGVFVDYKFWEKGKLPPFGDPTPVGAIGGFGTYDDTSDSIHVPDNHIDDIYANAFGGNGMHLYGVSGEGLKNFLSKVYTTDFWQYWANTLFNPMDGIISCLYLPINYGLINGANTNSVHVSNAELQTGEGKVKILYNYTYDTSTSVLPIEEYFGSFLDYAPYTSAELYLPFYGTVPINIDSIMGGSIKVQYRINLVTGTFSVFVICVDRFGVQTILQYAGSCGMSIPIVSGNNGAQNRITDLVQGIANVALGNYAGAGMNAVNALTEKGYVYTNSKISGSAGYDGVKDAFLTITRPVLSNPEKYSEIKQRPADMFVKLSELSGEYSIEKQNLDIHDKNITDEEITEIENILQGGAIF